MNRQSTTGKAGSSRTPKATVARKRGGKPSVPAVAGRKEMTRSTTSAGRTTRPGLDPQARREMIARAAYFRAERRGFAEGGELGDWLEAESEVERTLGG